MAAPNLVAVSTITAKSIGAALGASVADILTNTAGSGKVFKINSIRVANIDGTNNVNVTVSRYDASDVASKRLAYLITVPAQAALIISDRHTTLYLEEGDKITALASNVSRAEIEISYEELS